MTKKDENIIKDAEEKGIPIFVIVAKDAASVETLEAYKRNCIKAGSDLNHVTGINERIEEFRNWQFQNTSQVKVPD
jgi:hypothetical protein